MAELPTQRDFEDFSAWAGRDVVGPNGERLGAVEQIFLDEATAVPEWVLVRLGDEAAAFIPLAGARVEERSIRVEQDRERIAAAPRLEVEDTLTVAECRRLYDHYGLAYSEEASPTLLPEGADAQQPEERPRLRKYVGAPVPAPEETPSEGARADIPATKATGPAEPVPEAATPPTPIPAPAPRPIPPDGGFQAHQDGGGGSSGKLAVLKRRPALPIVLAGGIAALIALLALRKRR